MGSVAITLLLDEKGFTPALEKAGAAGQKFARTMEEGGHRAVSEMQAVSGTLRLVELDFTRNIRAVEKFITMIPGIGAALQVAFPVVGAIAFLGIIAKMGEEIAKNAHDLGQIRNVANDSFSALVEGSRKNADSLRVANDKLEEQIALMEHKPVNNLATTLDEARLRADDLAASLEKDYQAFKKVIEKSQEGTLNKILGKGVNSDLGNQMTDQLANIRTLGRQIEDAQRNVPHIGTSPTSAENASYQAAQAKVTELQQKLRAAQDASLSFAASQSKLRNGMVDIGGPIPVGMPGRISYAQANGDQGINFDAINAFRDVVGGQEDVSDQQSRNTGDQAQERKDRDAEKQRAAMEKAQALLLKTMQEGMAKQKAMYGVQVADELAYWSARIGAFARGSEQFHTVQMEQYRLQAELLEKLQEGKKKYLASSRSTVEGNDILAGAQKALQSPQTAEWDRLIAAGKQWNEVVAKAEEIERKNATAFAETSLAIALAQGSISKLDAAQATAAIHAHDHAEALKLVNQQLAEQIKLINEQPDEKVTPAEKTAAITRAKQEAGNQTASLDGAYARTQAEDAARVNGNTIPGAVKTSLNQMVQSFTDMASSLKEIIPRTIEGLNDDLAKLATGQGRKGDFQRTLKGAGEGLVNTAIKGAEGFGLKALGLGGAVKRDGSSKDAALWVQIAAGQAAIAGMSTSSPAVSAGVDLASLIPGGSFIQPFIKAASSFLPHFAEGGPVSAGQVIWTGENGPEPFVAPSSGTMIPNKMLGGGGDTHIHVDARGSNDPAAMEAAVRRGVHASIAGSVQAQHQARMRSPHGR
jgi:hypothetical protein